MNTSQATTFLAMFLLGEANAASDQHRIELIYRDSAVEIDFAPACGDFDTDGISDCVGIGSDQGHRFLSVVAITDTTMRQAATTLDLSQATAFPPSETENLLLSTTTWNGELLAATGAIGAAEFTLWAGAPPRIIAQGAAPAAVDGILELVDLHGDGGVELVVGSDRLRVLSVPALDEIDAIDMIPGRTDFLIANLDTDPARELVFAGADGVVLDGSTLQEQWRYLPGFDAPLKVVETDALAPLELLAGDLLFDVSGKTELGAPGGDGHPADVDRDGISDRIRGQVVAFEEAHLLQAVDFFDPAIIIAEAAPTFVGLPPSRHSTIPLWTENGGGLLHASDAFLFPDLSGPLERWPVLPSPHLTAVDLGVGVIELVEVLHSVRVRAPFGRHYRWQQENRTPAGSTIGQFDSDPAHEVLITERSIDGSAWRLRVFDGLTGLQEADYETQITAHLNALETGGTQVLVGQAGTRVIAERFGESEQQIFQSPDLGTIHSIVAGNELLFAATEDALYRLHPGDSAIIASLPLDTRPSLHLASGTGGTPLLVLRSESGTPAIEFRDENLDVIGTSVLDAGTVVTIKGNPAIVGVKDGQLQIRDFATDNLLAVWERFPVTWSGPRSVWMEDGGIRLAAWTAHNVVVFELAVDDVITANGFEFF